MEDDGQSFDLLAKDGIYGGKFEVPETGMYRITSVFEGKLDDGTPFQRSAELAMVTVDDRVTFRKNFAKFNMDQAADAAKDQLSVYLPVAGEEGTVVRAYAEVYGTSSAASEKAACWIGGYSVVKNGMIELEINKRWLVSAGVTAPFFLQRASLYDADFHVPLSSAAEISIQGSVNLDASKSLLENEAPSEEMLKGARPAHLHPEAAKKIRAALPQAVASLVLLHGYCAQDNPWVQTETIPFTDYLAYVGDLAHSVPNNVFAQNVMTAAKDLPSFGLLGHSQGGMAALHVHNFYWSGNDAASESLAGGESRAVQSVGSPYLGVTGAGAALDLGSLFGIGCGDNFDLTRDGATLWLAGISEASRSNVFYYTTKWKDSGLIKYCNLASNLVLTWPNDGTAEFEMCQLPGANPVQNPYDGECHTPNMKWPAQTANVARNAEINANAAR